MKRPDVCEKCGDTIVYRETDEWGAIRTELKECRCGNYRLKYDQAGFGFAVPAGVDGVLLVLSR